jgi:hypothetical protein
MAAQAFLGTSAVCRMLLLTAAAHDQLWDELLCSRERPACRQVGIRPMILFWQRC